PAEYLALVDAMPLAPSTSDESDTQGTGTAVTANGKWKKDAKRPPVGTFTAEQIARARERAVAYAVWDRELRQRGLVDFGGLIQRAVELLRADSVALADVRDRYREILVDEFQDTNRAAAELLLLVAGKSGNRLWVVGDHNQSIYRFRGASPHNLPRLVEQYPHLRVLRLRRCYRSVPSIVRLGSLMAERMAALAAPSDATTRGAEASVTTGMSALREAMRPIELEPVRGDGAHPAIRRHEAFVSATHEHMGLAASIQRHHGLGYTYGDQAVLCRTHKQARQIAAVLAAQGVPVSQTGDFFDRPEVKDALMLATLAAGPDARGILRATPLLIGLIDPLPPRRELATVARALAERRQPLPGALQHGKALGKIDLLSAMTRTALAALGDAAMDMHKAYAVGERLAAFLLRPGGYAWRLARIADGLDTLPARDPHTDDPIETDLLPWVESPSRAQQALAALGELVRLAWRFDVRWTHEPDFRARLSRAVTHRRAIPPAQPDALEPVPGTDVALIPLPAPQTQLTESAPAVRCFLHYLDALRASDVSVPVPAGEDNAVHVLTLHQSKGLEFPIVHLPCLAHGQFPAGASIREEASPQGFRESDAPGEREAEERCLLYVGVTRARDVVIFTRATSYGKGTGGSRRMAQPSTLLTLVDITPDSPDSPDTEPLLPDEELARLETLAAYEESSDDEDDDEAAPMAPADVRVDKPVIPLHHLEQYRTCPRQYKYARSYGLLDPAENAVHRFHRYVRRGEQALRDLHAAAPHAQWQAVEAQLQALWETDGPAGHAYDAFYWQAAEAILRAEWQAITTPQGAEASGRVLLAQPLLAELRQCIVEVTADRAITGVAPTEDAGAQLLTVLVRMHTGRPREEDKDDLTLPLYYLAHQQREEEQHHPHTPVQIALAYVGGALREQTTAANEPAPGDLIDVTGIAARDAEKYLKPDRRQRAKLDKLDEAALGIAAGRFEPRPDERRCASCAYCYVCPADPESSPSDRRMAQATAV
ncbi:MAG: UvrD-helicase domain-containing protein, partial [Ktedonobacterales bacterium]